MSDADAGLELTSLEAAESTPTASRIKRRKRLSPTTDAVNSAAIDLEPDTGTSAAPALAKVGDATIGVPSPVSSKSSSAADSSSSGESTPQRASVFDMPAHEASTRFRELVELEHASGSSGLLPMPTYQAAPRNAARIVWLSLTALGIIFGDIGTSPLYAYSTALSQLAPSCAAAADGCVWTTQQQDGLGILSLLLWSLTLVVTLQYVVVIISLDFHGEGGHMALAAQIVESAHALPFVKDAAVWAAIVGTGFVIGDGCLTPAISVLSAVEGIAIYQDSLRPWIVPISCVVLVALFCCQRFGTERVGFLFGPVMLVWFLSLAALGKHHATQCERFYVTLVHSHRRMESVNGRRRIVGVVGVESSARR
jgi:hypothetical protein